MERPSTDINLYTEAKSMIILSACRVGLITVVPILGFFGRDTAAVVIRIKCKS